MPDFIPEPYDEATMGPHPMAPRHEETTPGPDPVPHLFYVAPEETEQTAQAGPSWADVAASAYRAYAASTGNKNYLGAPMPAFENLPIPIQTAWEAAVRQVGSTLLFKYEGNESRWKGWIPPHLR